MNIKESDIQKRVVKFCRINNIRVIASANGIYNKDVKMIKHYKALAIISNVGMPDLFIPHVKRKDGIIEYCGLFIEMKRENGKLSKEQIDMLKILNDEGYKAISCFSYEDAKREIISYFDNHLTFI